MTGVPPEDSDARLPPLFANNGKGHGISPSPDSPVRSLKIEQAGSLIRMKYLLGLMVSLVPAPKDIFSFP